jgi:phosphoserine phosphatase
MIIKGGFVFTATLVAKDALHVGQISAAMDRLNEAGQKSVEWHWIAEGKAADLTFLGDRIAARVALEGQIGENDVIVQETAHRRRKLLVADMDSTMITVECIDELADYAGIKPQIAEVTERAMRGELDFEDALRSRVALLKGLPESVIARCLEERVKLMPGGTQLVQAVHDNGGKAVLVSGGFMPFANAVGAQLGFDQMIANNLGVAGGALSGEVEGAIVGAATKRVTLVSVLADNSWPISASIAVGDGANDIPMIEAAGLGVAYHAKPKTQDAAGAAIRFGNLEAIAYAITG